MCDISLEPPDSTKLYGVYTTLQMALDVCDSMNDYEAINHPNDIGTVTYRVEGVIPNRPSLNVNTVRSTSVGGFTINIPPGVNILPAEERQGIHRNKKSIGIILRQVGN